tara:strand:+ start:162 stop:362 length:201 start_codon:yes stop_codon:yes gene_type:complete
MIPQALLFKIAGLVFDKFIAGRLTPLEDYVHKDNEADIQIRELKTELNSLREQVDMLKELVIKYQS